MIERFESEEQHHLRLIALDSANRLVMVSCPIPQFDVTLFTLQQQRLNARVLMICAGSPVTG